METDAKDPVARDGMRPRPSVALPLAYCPREDATPQGELTALAGVYRFVLDRHESKKAAEVNDGTVRADVVGAGGAPHDHTVEEGA